MKEEQNGKDIEIVVLGLFGEIREKIKSLETKIHQATFMANLNFSRKVFFPSYNNSDNIRIAIYNFPIVHDKLRLAYLQAVHKVISDEFTEFPKEKIGGEICLADPERVVINML